MGARLSAINSASRASHRMHFLTTVFAAMQFPVDFIMATMFLDSDKFSARRFCSFSIFVNGPFVIFSTAHSFKKLVYPSVSWTAQLANRSSFSACISYVRNTRKEFLNALHECIEPSLKPIGDTALQILHCISSDLTQILCQFLLMSYTQDIPQYRDMISVERRLRSFFPCQNC